tara:strand:+ start:88 stop:192 length:105 start_codon:yes stop_codon:yes gene_type:complete
MIVPPIINADITDITTIPKMVPIFDVSFLIIILY